MEKYFSTLAMLAPILALAFVPIIIRSVISKKVPT